MNNYTATIKTRDNKTFTLSVQCEDEYDAHRRIRMICRAVRNVVDLNIKQVQDIDETKIGILVEI